MTAATTQPMPDGYSLSTQTGTGGKPLMWVRLDGVTQLAPLKWLIAWGAFVTDDAGVTRYDEAALAAGVLASDFQIDSVRIIPDAEMPADMSLHHQVFNDQTRLWEKPNIIDSVRRHHEGDRDFDVRAALFDFYNSQNRVRFMRFVMAENLRGLEGDAWTAARARHHAELDEYDAVRDARLGYAFDIVLTEALIDSLHRVEQEDDDELPTVTADRWFDEWAQPQSTALLTELRRRAALPTGAPGRLSVRLTDAVAKFAELLTADGQHAEGATARTWPRAVRFVTALATGDDADARERTLDSAIATVVTALNPPS